MTTAEARREAVDRMAALYEREVELRQAARQAELDPARREEAERTFRRASGLRKARLALLRRWSLL